MGGREGKFIRFYLPAFLNRAYHHEFNRIYIIQQIIQLFLGPEGFLYLGILQHNSSIAIGHADLNLIALSIGYTVYRSILIAQPHNISYSRSILQGFRSDAGFGKIGSVNGKQGFP